MVYPGNRRYRDKLVSERLLPWLGLPDLVPIGLLKSGGRWGLYATAQDLLNEVDDERLAEVTAAIGTTFPSARSVSLAARWPSLLEKAGIPHDRAPLVNATLGTVYAMDRVCAEMVRRCDKPPEQATLAILGGGGFVGRRLLPRLVGRYGRVVAVDTAYAQPEEADGALRTGDPSVLGDADAVLVLTPRGDDAAPYARFARTGQVWGDDTFPDMQPATQREFLRRGARLYKTSLVDETLRFVPPLPTFGSNHVPGCLVAAIVNERRPGLTDVDEFYREADQAGLRARLFEHRDDV